MAGSSSDARTATTTTSQSGAVIANFSLRFSHRSPESLTQPGSLSPNSIPTVQDRGASARVSPFSVMSICGQSARPWASALWAQRS
jgi:hypothetical protein